MSNGVICFRCKKHGTEEDVARFVNNSNREKQTAIHIASERSFCDGVKLLISYKADLSIKDHEVRMSVSDDLTTNVLFVDLIFLNQKSRRYLLNHLDTAG